MCKKQLVYIGIGAVCLVIAGLSIWTIVKHDTHKETVEGACYPDDVLTWRQEGKQLFVTCISKDRKSKHEVEVH